MESEDFSDLTKQPPVAGFSVTLDFLSIHEGLPKPDPSKNYLVLSTKGTNVLEYSVAKYLGEGNWRIAAGSVTHWAELEPRVLVHQVK